MFNPTESEPGYWPTELPPEALAYAYDKIIPGLGDALREAWKLLRPQPSCDCPMNPHHRWNCHLTPIWAQTMRDLDTNPWTVFRPHDLANTERSHP